MQVLIQSEKIQEIAKLVKLSLVHEVNYKVWTKYNN